MKSLRPDMRRYQEIDLYKGGGKKRGVVVAHQIGVKKTTNHIFWGCHGATKIKKVKLRTQGKT